VWWGMNVWSVPEAPTLYPRWSPINPGGMGAGVLREMNIPCVHLRSLQTPTGMVTYPRPRLNLALVPPSRAARARPEVPQQAQRQRRLRNDGRAVRATLNTKRRGCSADRASCIRQNSDVAFGLNQT
jgi:hypothetical protein